MTLIRQSVLDVWDPWNVPFEGRFNFLYVDTEGLVTTDTGNLMEPIEEALALPWEIGGVPATQDEITADWMHVKNNPTLPSKFATYQASATTIRLPDSAMKMLVDRKLNDFATVLQRRFSAFGAWPSPAQFAALSMEWAMGDARLGAFYRFSAACLAVDFKTAASECRMLDTGGQAQIDKRNQLNRALFEQAAKIITERGDFGALVYPTPEELACLT